MATQQYKLRVIKEMILDLDSEREATIIADMLADRESRHTIANRITMVYTEVEELV